MKSRHRVAASIASVIILLVAGALWLFRDVTIDVLQPAGAIAEQQRDLFWFTIILSAIVVVPVFTLLAVFAWKYREGAKAEHKPEWDNSHILEIIWWGIPIIIIAILSVVTWQTSHSLDPYRKIESEHQAIKVQVVALQWKWLFIYPELGVATVNKLPVPKDVPIHFTLSAEAPMSAFWVPSLGSQIYTMNGMSSQLNLIATRTGDYKGYSTNINGEGYAKMIFTVESRERAEFDAWVEEAKNSPLMMAEAEYNEIAKPGIIDTPRQYMLHDPDLYDKIVAKYLHTMPDGTVMGGSEYHNYDDHNMEGM